MRIFLWSLAAALILALLVLKDRFAGHETTLQIALGVCLAAMGLERFSRLIQGGWWKGDLGRTMREQTRYEGSAFLVALNVFIIGIACALAAVWHNGH